MSQSTPRRPRHGAQASGSAPRQTATSDHESDTANYLESRDAPPAPSTPAPRDDLNFRVLRRHIPNLESILTIAANAVVYSFSSSGEWEKSAYEGTMFTCQLEPVVVETPEGQKVLPQACVFVLNRRGLENFQVDLSKVWECEDTDKFFILGLEREAESADRKVWGLWIHADKVHTREINGSAIMSAWQECRGALGQLAAGQETAKNKSAEQAVLAAGQETAKNKSAEKAVQQDQAGAGSIAGEQHTGRRLSITDLFARGG